jgi:hypothetical protein
LSGLEIEDDTLLIRVIPSKRQAAVGMHTIVFERALAPHRIAGWRFDENHLGAQVGEEHAAVASPAAGEVENTQPGEWTGGTRFSSHFGVDQSIILLLRN